MYAAWEWVMKRERKGDKDVVLIATGSFNPPHKEHVQMFNSAKNVLEKQGYHVVGGLVSPSHDSYVKGKLGKEYIEGAVRAKMLDAALEWHGLQDWVKVDKWELCQERFVDHPMIGRFLKKWAVENKQKSADVKLFYMTGGDLYSRCCAHGHQRYDGLVVIDREGAEVASLIAMNSKPSYPHIFVPCLSNASSTRARELASTDPASLIELLDPTTAALFLEYRSNKASFMAKYF